LRGYFLVSDPEKTQRPTLQAFSHWLKNQLKASTQRWRKSQI
jgi:LysR family glycine cleavage system transcriptional activator